MKPTPGSAVFLDTNILVYAAFPSLLLHAVAVARLAEFRQLDVVFWISRQIRREFLAATTRPGAIEPAPPTTVLTRTVRDFAAGFTVAEDSSGVTAHLVWELLENLRGTAFANGVSAFCILSIRRRVSREKSGHEKFGTAARLR
jgi:predicted nucleic acid-binding protein